MCVGEFPAQLQFFQGFISRAVALTNHGRYSGRVPRLLVQRWALIFLLIGRLVMGELGHAMPMPNGHEAAATAQEQPACPEHKATAQPADEAIAADAHETPDCCKTGDCECPCLHVPCAGLDSVLASSSAAELRPIPAGIEGLTPQRPTQVFRPPA